MKSAISIQERVRNSIPLFSILLVISKPSTVQAETRTKIFGISLGPGGVKECRIQMLVRTNKDGNPYQKPAYVLPHGWREQQNKWVANTNKYRGAGRGQRSGNAYIRRATRFFESYYKTTPYPCFTRNELGFEGDFTKETINKPWKAGRENVKIHWPHNYKLYFPGSIKGGTSLSGFAINGAVESISLGTGGLIVEDQVLAGLMKKFGKPTILKTSTMLSSDGKSAKFKAATWINDELQVEFQGVRPGRRKSGNEFGAGSIYIRTKKGQALHERRLQMERGKTNL